MATSESTGTQDIENGALLDLSDDKPVACRRCGWSGKLADTEPAFSVYNDVRCPACGSTNNAHNEEYSTELARRMQAASAAPTD